jgi:hypothetical protein
MHLWDYTMSKNENVIYIFVKGNKGKFASEITDSNFVSLHTIVKRDLLDGKKERMSAIHADIQAMIITLEYIKENRGKNKIPSEPVTFIFTTFENNFHIANQLKNPDKCKDKIKQIDKIKSDLARSISDKDQVKVYWIPKDFKNRMEKVEQLLKDEIISSRYSP